MFSKPRSNVIKANTKRKIVISRTCNNYHVISCNTFEKHSDLIREAVLFPNLFTIANDQV